MGIGKKFSAYKGDREEHLNLLNIKVVSFATKLMIDKNSKVLTTTDYDRISLEAFRSKSATNRLRIYKLMNTPEVRDKINENLLAYYNARNIDLNAKVDNLMNKAEEFTKSTTDCINLARFYKEILDTSEVIKPGTNLTQINNNFHTYRTDPAVKDVTPDKEMTDEEINKEMENNINKENQDEEQHIS